MAAVTVKYLRHANRRNLVQATSLLPYLSPSLPTTATTAGTNDHWTVVMLHSSGGGGARRAPLDHASEGSQLCYFLALELLLLLISCDRLRLAPSPGFKKCSTGAFSALRSLARSFPPPPPSRQLSNSISAALAVLAIGKLSGRTICIGLLRLADGGGGGGGGPFKWFRISPLSR